MSQGGLLFLGDSDVDYWSSTRSNSYWAAFPNSSNFAVGGYTCSDVSNDDLDDILAATQPAVVILVCGENDLAYGRSEKAAFQRFESVVATIVATGSQVIYFGTK